MSENPENKPCNCPEDPNAMPGVDEARIQDRDCARRQADKAAASQGHAGVPLDFSTFVFSLATQAFVFLGETNLPGQEAASGAPQLHQAKQLIDLLELLSQKTKGNLSEAESHLLSNLLYDLRMRYVRLSRSGA